MIFRIFCAVVGVCCGIFSARADWVVDASALAAHGGGASSQSFATRAEAQAFINRYPGNGLRLMPGGSDRRSAAAVQDDTQAAADAAAQKAREEQARREADAQAAAAKAAHDAEVARQFQKAKSEALSQLKGVSTADAFDSKPVLKGTGSLNTGLKDGLYSSDASALKPLPASSPIIITDSRVVDARKVLSPLPKALDDCITQLFHDTAPEAVKRIKRAFEAVMKSDWHLADALFKDALNQAPRDPQVVQLVNSFNKAMQTPVPAPTKPIATSAKEDEELKKWWLPAHKGDTLESDSDWRTKARRNHQISDDTLKDFPGVRLP